MIIFSLPKAAAPAVAILPTLEVIISVRKGDDPKPVWNLCKKILDVTDANTQYVFDNCHEPLQLEKSTQRHYDEIRSALYQACLGPDTRFPIAWSYRTFLDVDHQDRLPECSCGLTLGWIAAPDQERGISFRVTVPDEKIDLLAKLGIKIAQTYPGLWRWISIGYRFITVQWYSSLMADALEIINGRSQRYLGVDVGDIFGLYASIWQNHLRTVNWMTFINDNLFHQLEDKNFKHSTIEHELLEKGILFKTGSLPILCDRNRAESIKPFAHIDLFLQKIRANNALAFSPMWDMLHATKWLNRFRDDRPFDFE
jgi:hypothetical protein